ncbi:hypothetical protein [Luteimonas vadosa]|uniref:Uncharacterized protein n=1 Tax=Luteimonas vadosa TaxID=1165507 RepID=A0ABP9DZC9_9GAMM
MLETLAFTLIVVAIAVVFLYVRQLQNVVAYAKARRLKICNMQYNNVYQIYSDFSFLSALFSGSACADVPDGELRQRLIGLRRLLIAQLSIGFVVFFLVAGVAASQSPHGPLPPNNSFKPNPHQGGAQVRAFGYICTRSPPCCGSA